MINLPFLKKNTQRSIGLDIGNSQIKVVEISASGNSLEILNLGMKSISQGQDVPQVVKGLFKEANISGKEVNISVSGDDVVARYISLPNMNDEELKKAMAFELEDHIPFKASEVYMDYTILGEEPKSKNRMRVFLVATKKEAVENKLKLVRESGLQAKAVTTDALVLKNAFYFNYPSKEKANIAVLNIGEKFTNLIICREGVPYFVRDTHFGGEVITSLLQTKAGLDKAKAEELKCNLKDASEDVIRTVKAAFATLLNEIFISIDFYENLTEQRINEVYLCGGSAKLFGLKEFLSGYLGIEIIDLDSFKNLGFSSRLSKDVIAKLSAYMTVAVGLALYGD